MSKGEKKKRSPAKKISFGLKAIQRLPSPFPLLPFCAFSGNLIPQEIESLVDRQVYVFLSQMLPA